MNDAENDDDVKIVLAMDEAFESLAATGFRKPVCMLGLSDRSSIISALLDFHLMAKVKTEMDQFRDGLSTFGFLDMVKANPLMWKPYFIVCGEINLTPGMYMYYVLFQSRQYSTSHLSSICKDPLPTRHACRLID